MISVYNIKPKFQQLLLPVLKKFHQWGISPNGITLSAILLSVTIGIVTWFNPKPFVLLLIPAGLLVRMALNALDGMMARQYNLQSRAGEVLNELGDVVSDLAIFFPLIKLFQVSPFLFLCFLFLSVINEMAGILGKAISGIRHYDGPMGKSDRAFFISILCLLFYFFPKLNQYTNFYFYFAIVLLLLSTSIRIHKTIKS